MAPCTKTLHATFHINWTNGCIATYKYFVLLGNFPFKSDWNNLHTNTRERGFINPNVNNVSSVEGISLKPG